MMQSLFPLGWGHYLAGGLLIGVGVSLLFILTGWIGGMSELDGGRLPLSLDARWIARAKAVGPFTLRNLRIEDPNHFVPLAKIAELKITADTPRLLRIETRA